MQLWGTPSAELVRLLTVSPPGSFADETVDDNNDGEITFGAVDKSKYDPKTTQVSSHLRITLHRVRD